jgi:UPF0716 protein FxsA
VYFRRKVDLFRKEFIMQILLGIFIFLVLLAGLEIYSISWLAQYIGFWETVTVVLLTGIAGAFIARKNAGDALRNLMKGDFRTTPPARQIFDTIAFFFAAALLLIPGLITDIAGIVLLIPWTRNAIYKRLTLRQIYQTGFNSDSVEFKRYSGRNNSLDADDVIDIKAED